MKSIFSKIALFAVFISLVSCAMQGLSTPSGRPEVTVRPPIKRAQNTAIETFSADGFALTSQTVNALVFERDLPPGQSALLLAGVGNSYHSQPKAVIRLTFAPIGDSVKIYGTVHAVTQGPFGQVKSLDITQGRSAQDLQNTLLSIQSRVGTR